MKCSEVKSLRDGKANISESYAFDDQGEIYLINSHIPSYKESSYNNHDPKRNRKLLLNKREIKQYIDTVFLDTGYRNRFKISETLDMLIEKKLEESEETEIYTNKDMADLLQMAHKMRIEEMKAQTELKKAEAQYVKNQVNIQHNSELPFGQGNYGELIKKLLK